MSRDPELLLETLGSLPAAAWTARVDGRVDWISPEVARFLGVPAPDENAWPRVVHPGDWPRVDAAWREAVAQGERYDVNVRLLCAMSGRYRWHLSRAHRLVDASGEVRWIGLNVDIDEAYREIEVQHASLERLQAERERLRGVFAHCPVAITVYQGPEHRIAMMNDANRRIVGGRDLEGQALAEAFPEIVSQGLVALVDRVRDTGEPFEASEFPVEFDRRGDGRMETAYFNFSLQALLDADGRVQGVLSSAIDVTEQVRARGEAGRLAAERATVLAQLDGGLVLADPDGRVTFFNAEAARLHGVPAGGEGVGVGVDLLREDGGAHPPGDGPLARAARRGEAIGPVRWRLRRPDGSEVHVEGSARPIDDRAGRRVGAVLTLREAPRAP